MITPYVKLDQKKIDRNIIEMIDGLKKYGIDHRPHVKPHKSVEIANLQLERGAIGITCATLTEVEVMAAHGFDDILLAIPLIGDDQWEKLNSILSKYPINFKTIVDSRYGIEGLNRIGMLLNQKINVLIDIDSGGHREGIQLDDLVSFYREVESKEFVAYNGLFTYYGHIYAYPHEEHPEKTREEAAILKEGKEVLQNIGVESPVLSGGSTGSSVNPEQLEGITESRAGNYVFYDMNAVHAGIITPDRCALRVVAKVISKPLEGKATIDAGSKAITSDMPLKGSDFGYVVSNPELTIVKLNEEHGFVEYNPDETTVEVGEYVEIIPNHACVIPNLYHEVFVSHDNDLKPLTVDARGRKY
ncbi:alanine racemase [Alkalibacillus haloalkaliphilus]|uniref:alanine racemase n=1 Tax=Alkalibacillus haloalkaliphilus TaxID=94136 RepID=UPI00031972EF|nr:alanine racemase [Alkalibacillus haloalkaliphilus]